MLRPDGTVFATGANTCGAGHTSIYNTANGTWTPGPNFPGNLSVADGPASIEINGKVLVMGSVNEGSPASFYEWNGTSLSTAPNPPNAANDGSYFGHLLALPTDRFPVHRVPARSGTLQSHRHIRSPIVTPIVVDGARRGPLVHGKSYVIQGLRFAGVSQGAAYGDDYQPYTNYALVRITNSSTADVFFLHCKTTKPIIPPVQSTATQKTHFAVPANIETGPSVLEVVTNGIPSPKISYTVN